MVRAATAEREKKMQKCLTLDVLQTCLVTGALCRRATVKRAGATINIVD